MHLNVVNTPALEICITKAAVHIVQCLSYMYIFLKCVKYHHCRTLQISMLLLCSHGSIYTINDYSSYSNYELFGIPLFVGPFSQGFSLVCSQPTLRTSRLFLSLQSISVCLFPFEFNPFITHWSKNCRERHSQALSSIKVQFNQEK